MPPPRLTRVAGSLHERAGPPRGIWSVTTTDQGTTGWNDQPEIGTFVRRYSGYRGNRAGEPSVGHGTGIRPTCTALVASETPRVQA